jgi:hypothetical protein
MRGGTETSTVLDEQPTATSDDNHSAIPNSLRIDDLMGKAAAAFLCRTVARACPLRRDRRPFVKSGAKARHARVSWRVADNPPHDKGTAWRI